MLAKACEELDVAVLRHVPVAAVRLLVAAQRDLVRPGVVAADAVVRVAVDGVEVEDEHEVAALDDN